jgi:hypothetical protein
LDDPPPDDRPPDPLSLLSPTPPPVDPDEGGELDPDEEDELLVTGLDRAGGTVVGAE